MNFNELAYWLKKHIILISALLFWSISPLYAQESVDLDKGLIGHYSFQEDADDQSGNGNDGEVDGPNLEVGVDGEAESGYRWNDEDDFIKIPIDINIGAIPKLSMCAWVFVKSYSKPVTVISNDDRGGDRKIVSTKVDKVNVWSISDGKGGYIGKEPVIRNSWVFLVATYDEDKGVGSIYVDGVKTSGKTQMDMGASFTYIGANPYENSNEDFEALIDEVRFYDRILTSEEIGALRDLEDVPLAKEKEAIKISYIYLVKQDNLIVRAQKSIESKSIGSLNMSDTLVGKEVKAKNVQWAEWLEVPIDGKTGYVQLKYLDKTREDVEPESELSKSISKYTDWSSWQFWVITLGVLLFSYGASMQFHIVDGWLNTFTRNDFEGNLAFFPVFTGLSGVVFALLMVVWQDQIEYYLSGNFTLWPSGYGFAAWAIWVILIANAVVFAILLKESLLCGNLLHGISRVVIQLVVGALTFVSSVVITIALILIVIGILVVSIAVSALFYRRVYTDMWGNTYEEV